MNISFKNVLNKSIKSPRAFTLIETLVSTMIITTVILGPLTVASNASAYARQTKDVMTALYLAQEATELLHGQQESLYLRCISQYTEVSPSCTPQGDETPGEAAWRMFKERLGYNAGGASCYTTDNPAGCTYDFIDMTGDPDFNPTKYSATNSACKTLSISSQSTYVCTEAHGTGPSYTPTTFSRVVRVTSINTYSAPDESYNDDIRATVTVNFRRSNGFTRQIKVVDFFHAK
jgi:type II secretory pathway pseudopilin PulG